MENNLVFNKFLAQSLIMANDACLWAEKEDKALKTTIFLSRNTFHNFNFFNEQEIFSDDSQKVSWTVHERFMNLL